MDELPQPQSHGSGAPSYNSVDEGFSEAMEVEQNTLPNDTPEDSDVDTDTDTDTDTDMPDHSMTQYEHMKKFVLAQPVELRVCLAKDLMTSLPTSELASIVEVANGRLHFDPLNYLPPELSTNVFRHLNAKDLNLSMSVSRTWRAWSSLPATWKRLYKLQGWIEDSESIRIFEKRVRGQLDYFFRHYSQHGREGSSGSAVFSSPAEPTGVRDDSIRRLWTHGLALWFGGPGGSGPGFSGPGNVLIDICPLPSESMVFELPGPGFTCPLLYPSTSRELISRRSQLQINWRHLYNQRRRLEENWKEARYKCFRIPREDHDHQKHGECVYTLQFSSKLVVSGSRDKTVRVWDMEKKILRLPPLVGHRGSVLCLQFDEKPNRDVIISGGSDSCVIVWKLSTGAILKHIKKAHAQAVLNLRFDDRYLVTCSKDGQIKVWNMARLAPKDDAYPATNATTRDANYPDYIIDKTQLHMNPTLGLTPPLEPYTLLMTLTGHSAAVNAISMHQDEIVSVSGDRKIMRWQLATGSLIKTYSGHGKGIACVHYDGRRIVSGSSDESVRIFDPTTTLQLAELTGHRDLVRTIQADFGDVPGDAEMYEAKANAHSRRVLEEKNKRLFGEIPDAAEDDQFIVGAKLPPGGGGNKWAKIVSGSYDETVIIWKQDRKSGKWFCRHKLKHEAAVFQTSSSGSPPSDGPPPSNPQPPQHPRRLDPQGMGQNAQNSLDAAQLQLVQQAHRRAVHAQQARLGRIPLNTGAAVPHQQLQPPIHGGQPSAPPPTPAPRSPPQNVAQLHPGSSTNPQQTAARPAPRPLPHPQFSPLPAAAARTQNQEQAAQQGEEEEGTSRLFKLQFDARRIVCCSQQPIIIGWDFANGDKTIMEASQFFGETM